MSILWQEQVISARFKSFLTVFCRANKSHFVAAKMLSTLTSMNAKEKSGLVAPALEFFDMPFMMAWDIMIK